MENKISERREFIAQQIVDVAIKVHRELGPGLLESVYMRCFSLELEDRGIPFYKETVVPIVFGKHVINDGLRLDLIVDNLVIVELKAQENYHPVWEAQLLSYLRLSGIKLGFLINFHVPLVKNGIKRMIL